MSELFKRTIKAFGEEFIKEIQKYRYCIVGCGGTGTLFAEMLVRTGANKIILIDGDKVEESNLNRTISFTQNDIGEDKVNALMSKLKGINNKIEVTTINCCLRKYDLEDDKGQKARDAVYNSDIVIISMDRNKCRMVCEELCREDSKKKIISMGVYIEDSGNAGYECTWKPKTPINKKDEEGYGNGSYISIVTEATSVAFSMLLHNLKNPTSSDFRHYFKSYENFIPKSESVKKLQK